MRSTMAPKRAARKASNTGKRKKKSCRDNRNDTEETAAILMNFGTSEPSPAHLGKEVSLCTATSEDKDLLHSTFNEACGEKTIGSNMAESKDDDDEKRLAAIRERNRQHARQTRLRKKARLEALQSKAKALRAESCALKQSIKECSIASILVGLSSGSNPEPSGLLDLTMTSEAQEDETNSSFPARRSVSFDSSDEAANAPLELNIDGQLTTFPLGGSHINWKNGAYKDEKGVQRKLTAEQLKSIRRERNRIHAKLSRNRKKNFITTIEKDIEKLEGVNQKMKDILSKVGHEWLVDLVHFRTEQAEIFHPSKHIGDTTMEEPKLTDEEGSDDCDSVAYPGVYIGR